MAKTTHGMFGARFYRIFWKINERCNDKKHPYYRHYGGKGIRNEWKKFEDFMKDMHKSYEEHVKKYGTKQTTIDRIDNDKNYSKVNCRWATYPEQIKNRKLVKKLYEYNGSKKTFEEWSKIYGMKKDTLRCRVQRYGWDMQKALTTKVVPRRGKCK